jgi:hypothetical protein
MHGERLVIGYQTAYPKFKTMLYFLIIFTFMTRLLPDVRDSISLARAGLDVYIYV